MYYDGIIVELSKAVLDVMQVVGVFLGSKYVWQQKKLYHRLYRQHPARNDKK